MQYRNSREKEIMCIGGEVSVWSDAYGLSEE